MPARRDVLKQALGGALLAAVAGRPGTAQAQAAAPAGKIDNASAAPVAAMREFDAAVDSSDMTVAHPGSDVMVDVIKSLGIQYVALNPGSSFRGLHESIINYGQNHAPELITCLHEETSVAMAAGYARVTGKPMAVIMHSSVGLQHGAMSVYHAFCDRVPVLMFVGASLDAATRRPFIEWLHAAQDEAAIVREFVKWDDQPLSIQHFAESTVRAAKLATTVPMGPVLISVDGDLQEKPVDERRPFALPRLSPASQPVGDVSAIREIARQLVQATAPVILAQRYARSMAGMPLLVELAELLQAPVIDSYERFNFPTDHPLNQTQRMRSLVAQADAILVLEPVDLWGSLNKMRDQKERPSASGVTDGVAVFTIGSGDLFVKSNYQEFQRYAGVKLAINGDAESSLPSLIEAVKAAITPANEAAAVARGAKLKSAFESNRKRDREEAKYGWEASPITTARLSSEIWDSIKGDSWVLASQTQSLSFWPQRLWDMNKPDQYVGSIGAGGVGSSLGCATGTALAYRGSGRIVVNIQNDGDLWFAPGALWTAVHHAIPILHVVHNNRAYHQEVMHIQRMANRRERGIDRAHIGTEIDDPPVNFAKLAGSMGMWSAGPIAQPGELQSALRKAINVVKQGRPALVEVLTQPR